MKNLKAFFGFTQNMAVVWYRMVQLADKMRKLGAEVAYSKYSSIDSDIINWQFDLDNALVLAQINMLCKESDVTVFGGFRDLKGVALIQAMKTMYGKPILMEMDDYIFNLPAYNIASNAYKPNSGLEHILKKQIAVSDGMIVSTETLKEYYQKLNNNVYVIPNAVDEKQWKLVKKPVKDDSRIRIGFAGSPNHTGDIRLVRNVILKMLKKYPNVEFYCMGVELEFFKGYDRVIVDTDWVSVDKYPQRLADANIDIAIAPLKDNNFNRGKSNLRYLENSMLKVPVIATDIDAYNTSIHHGIDGFLCKTELEWENCIELLILNKKERIRIGNAGYKNVVKNFNIKDIAQLYIDTLKDIVSKRKK